MGVHKQGLIPRYVSRYDIVDAWYWWLVDHHEGQWSERYARMSRLGRIYRPSRLANGPDGEIAQDIYDNLCEKEGCIHEKYS
jgi:hypothetical protein